MQCATPPCEAYLRESALRLDIKKLKREVGLLIYFWRWRPTITRHLRTSERHRVMSSDDEDPQGLAPRRRAPLPKYRNICFTVNAQDGVELRLLDFAHPTWAKVKYLIYQREMGEHEHFQGYMELTAQLSFKQLHKLEGLERAHFEKRLGSAKQAIHYCSKPHEGCTCNQCLSEAESPTFLEGPWIFGEANAPGQRTELLLIQADLNRGKSLKRIAQDNFPEFIRFGRAFKEYRRVNQEPRNFKPVVILLVGRPGAGKSRFGLKLAEMLGQRTYIVPDKHSGFWCDDYDGEDVFFMDETDGSRFKPTFFNGLVDRYPFVVPAHGHAGSQLVAKYMVFCSNYLPKYWWKKRSPLQLEQTLRRIDIIIPFVQRRPEYVHSAHNVFLPGYGPMLPHIHCDICAKCCICAPQEDSWGLSDIE